MSTKKVTIREVGPRDGFQNIAEFIPTDEKVSIINKLSEAGVSHFEVSSFVHPKWIPQLKDADEVFSRIVTKQDGSYCALVPNEKGLERAIRAGVKEVQWVMSCTDSSNKENLNMTVEDSLALLAQAAPLAHEHGVVILLGLANTFGCPWEGVPSFEKVSNVIETARGYGVHKVMLCDSIGRAHPELVKDRASRLIKAFPDVKFTIHLHDILGLGVANAYAAYEAGITDFDSSIAGLGGCPYAVHPGGNVATEKLVNMFEGMGVETGINLEKVIETADYVRSVVGENPEKQVGHPEEPHQG